MTVRSKPVESGVTAIVGLISEKAMLTPRFSHHVGYVLFAAFLSSVMLGQALMNIVLAAFALWWLCSGNVLRDLRQSPPYVRLFLAFALLPILSVFTSDVAAATEMLRDLPGAIKRGLVLLPILAISRCDLQDTRSLTGLLVALVGCALGASAYGLAHWQGPVRSIPTFRAETRPNHASLVLLLPLAAALLLTRREDKRVAAFGWIGSICIVAMLALMMSFNAYFIMACIVLLYVCVSARSGRRRTVLSTFACLVLAATLASGIASASSKRSLHAFFLYEVHELVHSGNPTSGAFADPALRPGGL